MDSTQESVLENTPAFIRPILPNFVDSIPQDIYVDVSNVYSSMKHNLGIFIRSFEDGKLLNRRIAFGSKVTQETCEWERQFKSFGFQTRCEIRPSEEYESMVDDCIAAHIYRVTLRQNEKVRIVVVSGDGNQKNSTAVGIYDSILMALMYGISVTVWGWEGITSGNYKNLISRFPNQFNLRYLDDIKDTSIPRTPIKMVVPNPKGKCVAFFHVKIMTKDKTPFCANTQEKNTKIFAPLFAPHLCMSVSKSPINNHPHILFAYFATAEFMDLAIEVAQKHPFLILDGIFKELEFEKCAAPGTAVSASKKTLNDSSNEGDKIEEEDTLSQTQSSEISEQEGILPTPPEIEPVEPEKIDLYSLVIRGNKMILPYVDAKRMKKCFIDNFKTIPVAYSSGSPGAKITDQVFCNFPGEEFCSMAIKHIQETNTLIINGAVYQVTVSPKPKKYEKRQQNVSN